MEWPMPIQTFNSLQLFGDFAPGTYLQVVEFLEKARHFTPHARQILCASRLIKGMTPETVIDMRKDLLQTHIANYEHLYYHALEIESLVYGTGLMGTDETRYAYCMLVDKESSYSSPT
jgi:hypothetical protein